MHRVSAKYISKRTTYYVERTTLKMEPHKGFHSLVFSQS